MTAPGTRPSARRPPCTGARAGTGRGGGDSEGRGGCSLNVKEIDSIRLFMMGGAETSLVVHTCHGLWILYELHTRDVPQ